MNLLSPQPATSSAKAGKLSFNRDELEGSLVGRFCRVAEMYPGKLALAGDRQSFTFAQLHSRSVQIAHAILQASASANGCVAILVDHSPAMVICALAILKAAKAYLCIHPRMPEAAQRDVIADAVPDVILTDTAHAIAARKLAGDGIVLLLEEVDANAEISNPLPLIAPSSPAAIFYTSGSTGRPKGIVKSHRAILHRAWLSAQYDGITPADRQSLLTYCSFASSEADTFGSLLNGASVHLFDAGSRRLDEFGTWIDQEQITVLHPPVVLFRRYLSTLDGADLHPTVRLIAMAGETVLPADIQQWRKRFANQCALRNRFSSTEAGHIAVACIEPGSSELSGARAVTDKHISIAGKANEVGELIVRSAFLSDGYWRRPADTANDFPPDPSDPEMRTFHTGDLGRLLPDGSFEFHGRRDEQVKVRGYRVELREIENGLCQVAGINEAAVIAERDQNESRLIAYVVSRPDGPASPAAIIASLRKLLPEWKIPAEVHPVDTLPLTLTGKVDRQLLRQRTQPAARTTPSIDSATSPIVACLTSICAELFTSPGISPDDDFFDLGGHSLLAAQLLQRIKQELGASLPFSAIAQRPTMRRLAELLDQTNVDPPILTSGEFLILNDSGKGEPLFFIPPADGTALTYVPLSRLVTCDRPQYALLFSHEDERVDSIEELAGRFIERLRNRQPNGPYHLCGHSFGGVLAYEMARQLRAQGQPIGLLALLDSARPGARRWKPKKQPSMRDRLKRVKSMGVRGATVAGLRNAKRWLTGPGFDIDPGIAGYESRSPLFKTFRPEPYDGVITLFQATEHYKEFEFELPGPVNGWDTLCKNIEVHRVPGDHLTMISPPNLTTLGALLSERLLRNSSTVSNQKQ